MPYEPDQEAIDRWRALRDEIREHPGTRATAAWKGLLRVHTLFLVNQRELLQLIDTPSKDEELAVELVQNVSEPVVREQFFDELYRRLHNYVASMVTLIDHSRNIVESYDDGPFTQEYARRKDGIIKAPVCVFVRRLRNYFLHHQLPGMSVTVQFPGSDRSSCELRFPSSSLLEWDDWQGGRDYIVSKGDNVPLADPVNEYAAQIGGLYDWLYPQFEVLHSQDVDEVNELIRQQNAGPAGMRGERGSE